MKSSKLGGVIHTYQRYDPQQFPSPTQPPPDLVSPAFEHLLEFGELRDLTEEELARAVPIDIRQFAGLGPTLDSLKRRLEERKRKILETYSPDAALQQSDREFQQAAQSANPPKSLRKAFERAVREEQLRELEMLWYRAGEKGSFPNTILKLVELLGTKYQLEDLVSKYEFTGHTKLTIPQALEIKEELETIDKLLRQLEEAAKTAQIGVIDLEEISPFASQEELDDLSRLQRQVSEYLRQLAEQQGMQKTRDGYSLSPKAYRLFQGKLLEQIFSDLQPSKSGRHQNSVTGEGAVELERTRAYEFGDSVSNCDLTGSFINALVRQGPGLPVRLEQRDLLVHHTRNRPKCATTVLLDMSGSMRYGGLYYHVKRMGLALDGLLRREYPGDFLQFVEMYSIAKPCHSGDLVKLLPKPVSIFDPVVRLKADMSDPQLTEDQLPLHFTNIQHAMRLGRQFLNGKDTPNRQMILITDGLPTAHFEGSHLYLLYPSDPLTEAATMREAQLCSREGITINIFLLSSWSQSVEDIRFAHRLAETTKGRVYFTAGKDLDRYVVWDYVNRRKQIVG